MSNKNGAIRVLVIDAQAIVRLGVEYLLESDQLLAFEAGVASIGDLDGLVASVEPDVLIIDPWPDGGAELDALQRAREKLGNCKIIVYTSSSERTQVVGALELGVRGYLLKQGGLDELIAGIRKVNEGCAVLAPDVANQLVVYLSRKHEPERGDTRRALTERELEVLSGLAQGKSNRVIGQVLYICEATVKFHVHSILEKLQAGNRTEAVLVAAREGLIDLDAEDRRSVG
jgi:DNA-binding NarL/FixJ family response regulator